MNIKVTFRSMDHSSAIESFVLEKLAKIKNFLEESERSPIYIEVTLTAGFTHAHNAAEIIVKSPNYDFFSSDEGPDMYKVITSAIDKMNRELTKAKEERIDKRVHGNQHRGIEEINKNFEVDDIDDTDEDFD